MNASNYYYIIQSFVLWKYNIIIMQITKTVLEVSDIYRTLSRWKWKIWPDWRCEVWRALVPGRSKAAHHCISLFPICPLYSGMILCFMISLYSCLFNSLGAYLAIQWMIYCQLKVPWLPTHAVSGWSSWSFISWRVLVSLDPTSVSYLLIHINCCGYQCFW